MSRVKYLPLLFVLSLLGNSFGAVGAKRTTDEPPKRFEKDGLVFEYDPNWELSDQSNAAAQQFVLTEKALVAQIMIIALRTPLTSAKQEEQAKAAVIEPSINGLLKQYDIAGIKVERIPAKTDVAGSPAEGEQLRFEVDRQPGATDIYWRVINQRMVQLFFIRPEKTAAKTVGCWDLIRNTLKVEKGKEKAKNDK